MYSYRGWASITLHLHLQHILLGCMHIVAAVGTSTLYEYPALLCQNYPKLSLTHLKEYGHKTLIVRLLLAAYQMALQDSTGNGLDGFMIQFNNNALGVLPASQHIPVQLPPGGSSPVTIPLQRSQNMVSPAAGRTLQVSTAIWNPKYSNITQQQIDS